MSKSASDPNFEDVLSSVRRLVSGELPRKPRSVLPEGPGALVLKESQRVTAGPRARVASQSLEDRIAELEAAVGDKTDEFEPDGSEDQDQHRPDRIVYSRPPTADEECGARRNALGLNQIALVGTGPANDGDEDEVSLQFRHEENAEQKLSEKAPAAENTPVVEEAPMAVDVPTARVTSADVAAFTDPDAVAERIAARWSGRNAPETEVFHKPAIFGKQDEATTETEIDDDDFEVALNEAVQATNDRPGFEEAAGAFQYRVAEPEPQGSKAEGQATGEPNPQKPEVEVSAAVEPDEDKLNADDPGLNEPDPTHANPAPQSPDEATFTTNAAEPVDALHDSGDELGVAEALEVEHETTDPETTVVDEALDDSDDQDLDGRPYFLTEDEFDGEDDETPDEFDGEFDAEIDTDDAGEDLDEIAEVFADNDDEPEDEKPESTTLEDEVAPVLATAELPDEDEVRRLVSRLIREELQGELGEHITRNVRKLVRREIMRALNSRDLA